MKRAAIHAFFGDSGLARNQMQRRRLLILGFAIAFSGILALSVLGTSSEREPVAAATSAARSADQSSSAIAGSRDGRADSAPPANSAGSSEATARSAEPSSSVGSVAPVLNWQKYPGSLDSQVHKALDTRDGPMAMDLANKLMQCDLAARLQGSSSRQTSGPQLSVAAQAEWVKLKQEEQRLFSNCQSIAGGYEEIRSRLLELAFDQKVVGSGIELFAAGVRRADVLQGVAADAAAGDVKSLLFATAYQAQLFGLTADAQNALRYGFELASRDPQVGLSVRHFYDHAQALSGPLGGTAQSKFDSSSISESARADGAALAIRIVQRIKSNG